MKNYKQAKNDINNSNPNIFDRKDLNSMNSQLEKETVGPMEFDVSPLISITFNAKNLLSNGTFFSIYVLYII